MKKKTIKFEAIREKTNILLASPNLSVEFKEGVIAMYEHAAHATDNYNGYMYLGYTSEKVLPSWGTQEHVTRKYF